MVGNSMPASDKARIVSFSGGVSVAEYPVSGTTVSATPDVEYLRGSDMGGGIGGILYSLHGGSPLFSHYNHRGDVVARTDASAAQTWRAKYEGFGEHSDIGENPDRQRANTRDEDPSSLLYENMRYRDPYTGTYLTRDPAGFIDGPNLYAYVTQKGR